MSLRIWDSETTNRLQKLRKMLTKRKERRANYGGRAQSIPKALKKNIVSQLVDIYLALWTSNLAVVALKRPVAISERSRPVPLSHFQISAFYSGLLPKFL